jgi:hypothetical protein
MSNAAQKPNELVGQEDSDRDAPLALAAVGAIHHLISERNMLRGQAVAHTRELTRLREYVALIRDSYRRLTSEYVTQLQHMDSAVSTVVQEPNEPADSPTCPEEKRDVSGD